jgi:hypothetical protein
MSKKPNIPMNHAITTCRHKVDRKKFDDGWDRIWGKSSDLICPYCKEGIPEKNTVASQYAIHVKECGRIK